MKLLIVGDIHLRGNSPRNRKGDFMQDMLAKVREVCDIAHSCEAQVVCVGDIFDSPSASYGVYGELAKVLRNANPWITVAGNHDLWGHNLSTLPRTPYGALMTSGLIQHIPDSGFTFGGIAQVHGVSFDHSLDRDMHEYIPAFREGVRCKILVVHGMLMPDAPPFERFTLIDDVAENTTADIIISGHFHQPFIHTRKGKLFINPGALCRLSATEQEIARTPSVVLLDTDTLRTEIIPLQCAKPGIDVLDRDAIEENYEREERMETFIANLEFSSESRFMNLQEIIETIAKQDGVSDAVLAVVMSKLAEAREKRG